MINHEISFFQSHYAKRSKKKQSIKKEKKKEAINRNQLKLATKSGKEHFSKMNTLTAYASAQLNFIAHSRQINDVPSARVYVIRTPSIVQVSTEYWSGPSNSSQNFENKAKKYTDGRILIKQQCHLVFYIL